MLICAVVPVYNHGGAVGCVVAALRAQNLPCVLVDDGSDADCAAVLDALAAADEQVCLVRLPQNRGKGGAMMAGLRAALGMGYSHALQIDADGQHDSGDIPRFLQLARAQPKALICGCPLYDADAPKSRRYGRYATHVWVWINTLSLQIRDAMCGFRVYPLAATVPLFDRAKLGLRMDFDVEVLVRLSWRGMRIVNLPTRVSYPLDGISHFQLWRDNLRISRMHAKLFFGMLPRLPLLLARKAAR
ncbi:glycosyltransferase family 2 protein [Chromobacterium sphagni]|uniref:Glycosyl transferase n=1 Tax=Chromobacterium sphagni TaxID=1903179 RepID=A0ABX3C7T7_9NEIS|nr:glycosyltransferase family 2 protein [Chromobacterium sphagni]OHX16354.1 glycosyl transferase [Chromobacterium sphagni]